MIKREKEFYLCTCMSSADAMAIGILFLSDHYKYHPLLIKIAFALASYKLKKCSTSRRLYQT